VSTPVLAPSEPLRVHVRAADTAVRAEVLTMLRTTTVLAADHPSTVDSLVLVAARTLRQALAVCPPRQPETPSLMIIADMFTRDGVLHALRLGVTALLPLSTTTPDHLIAGLCAVRDGDDRMPHEELVRLLGTVHSRALGDPPRNAIVPPHLTVRQTAVLRLMADGFGNTTIGRVLSCSEHTVKNVIYELMARLHARNRAHAVAVALRLGFI
jgi:DNA-binding NarL/FixJ family response regulator